MAVNDLVLRIGGESGDGYVSTGDILGRISAQSGYEVYTFRTFPAEILGGHVMFQVRIGTKKVTSRGDKLDILVATNQDGYEKHYRDLREDGLIVYDSNSTEIPAEGGWESLGVPVVDIARKLKYPRGKNAVLLGALVHLIGLNVEEAEKMIMRRWGRKSAEIGQKNIEVMRAGLDYAAENWPEVTSYRLLAPKAGGEERLIMDGNQAISIGALAGGANFYGGYPITPASSIMEFLAAELPKFGGVMIQAEDEIAAINMVIGASFAGAHAMTATSGPGVALMSEALGLASITEIPVVLVDVQRVGPSTGMPTKTDQSDLNLAIYGTAGEAPKVVLAVGNVEECFYVMGAAFSAAEHFQVPVLVLSDQDLSNRIQTVPVFDINRVKRLSRVLPDLDSGKEYERYALTESGISPMSIPGMEGGYYTAESLEHKTKGAPSYEPDNRNQQMKKRCRKMETISNEMVNWELFKYHGDRNPEIAVLGWGTSEGAVVEAIDRCRAKGISVGAFYTNLLHPLPAEKISEFVEGAKVIFVPELNYRGQYANWLRSQLGLEAVRYNRYDGLPFIAGEIEAEIEKLAAQIAAF